MSCFNHLGLFLSDREHLANQEKGLSVKQCFKLDVLGLPRWLSNKESACQCRRCGFDPWVGKIPWRRKWQSTPVLLPGKSHGQRSLVGYSPWGRKESDRTERLHFHFTITFMAIRTSWSKPQSAPGLVFVDCICIWLIVYVVLIKCSFYQSYNGGKIGYWYRNLNSKMEKYQCYLDDNSNTKSKIYKMK